jgi:hypothetical protein
VILFKHVSQDFSTGYFVPATDVDMRAAGWVPVDDFALLIDELEHRAEWAHPAGVEARMYLELLPK